MPTREQLRKENPQNYCPKCGKRTKPTKLSNYKDRFCKNCYKIYSPDMLIQAYQHILSEEEVIENMKNHWRGW